MRWGLLAITVALAAQSANAISVYQIGNSLTNDARKGGIDVLAAAAGYTDHVQAWHIRCGSSLRAIWNNPTETCVAPTAYGLFGDALAGYSWDAVTLQPHHESTLGMDRYYASQFIDLTPATTKIYVYATWPRISLGDYATVWQTETTDDDAQVMVAARSYFHHLADALRADHPDREIFVIPVGEVFYEVEQRLASGALVIDGVTGAHDLYRDNVHATDLGRYLAALTHYAVLYGESPVNLGEPDATELALQGVVWDVVRQDVYTGVPEPCTIVVLALGVLIVGARRRV